jgi:hypothetical protein
MNLRVLAEAENEALQAAFWYDERRDGLGDEFISEYETALSEIESSPLRFGSLETQPRLKSIRRCLLKRFPYLIIFEVLADDIVVLAVTHGSRRTGYWSQRRQPKD